MKLNNVVKSILKTAVYLMDQTADTVDRASSRASAWPRTHVTQFIRAKITPCEIPGIRRRSRSGHWSRNVAGAIQWRGTPQ